MSLTLQLIDWIKQIALPNVDGPYPINWRLEKNKKGDLPQDKGGFPLFDSFELEHWSSLSLCFLALSETLIQAWWLSG